MQGYAKLYADYPGFRIESSRGLAFSLHRDKSMRNVLS